MDESLKEETPHNEYVNSRYILDAGKDFLFQQMRQVDAGELSDVRRKFQVIFISVNIKYVSFLVHKAFIPHLGDVIGEMIKIRFPKVKRVGIDEPIEWMARVVVVGEHNLNHWWEKGFDADASDEVGITLEFLDLPLNREDTARKCLEWKFNKIKKRNQRTFLVYLRQLSWILFIRFAKFGTLALMVMLGLSYWVAPTVEDFMKGLKGLQTQVIEGQALKEAAMKEVNPEDVEAMRAAANIDAKKIQTLKDKVLEHNKALEDLMGADALIQPGRKPE